jgi:F-type H+-transporting ATPase subunit epsilon
MAGTFSLQIVTPEREVYSSQVEMVSLPGMQSHFGVLRNHAPLIAALEPGVVSITDAELKEVKLAIGGGFFQVAKNTAILLADSAEFPHEINLDRVRESESQARRSLDGELEDEQMAREQAEAALKLARVRMRLVNGK